jgi:outer membrane lipoprotein LolB
MSYCKGRSRSTYPDAIFAARFAVYASLLLALGGCATLGPNTEREAGPVEPFELQGRVFARFGTSAFTGTIRWQHELAGDQVWLGGPFGQGAAHIERGAEGATLTTADHQTYHANSVESLTRNGLGWALPLADLGYYVLDKPPVANGEARVQRNGQEQIVRVTHDGWNVDLTRAEPGSAVTHPTRIRLSREGVEIRLVIDHLEISPRRN